MALLNNPFSTFVGGVPGYMDNLSQLLAQLGPQNAMTQPALKTMNAPQGNPFGTAGGMDDSMGADMGDGGMGMMEQQMSPEDEQMMNEQMMEGQGGGDMYDLGSLKGNLGPFFSRSPMRTSNMLSMLGGGDLGGLGLGALAPKLMNQNRLSKLLSGLGGLGLGG